MAVEESELFLQSTDFLNAPTAEEAFTRHLEFDAEVADRFGIDPAAIWRAASTIDLDRITGNHRPQMILLVILAVLVVSSGEAGAFGFDPKWTHCEGCDQVQEQAKPK
jgi:hypothetical protein